MMDAQVIVTTHGYDDAEAIAKALEEIAATIRKAGGGPVEITDRVAIVSVAEGGQQEVGWSCFAS